jgi:hypothetical protein
MTMPTRTMTITEKRGRDNNSPHRSSLLLRSLVVTFGVCLIPRLYTVTFRPPSGLVSNLDNFVAAVTTTSCDKIHESGRKNTRKPAMATLTDTLGQRPTMTFGTFHTWARLGWAWIRPDNAAADAKDIFTHGVGDDQALGASTSSRNTSRARSGRPQPRHDLLADLAHLLHSLNVGRNDAADRPARSGRCSGDSVGSTCGHRLKFA